jgi:hypothetical protein
LPSEIRIRNSIYLFGIQVGDEILDSIVYIDVGTLEAFQPIGAFPLLLDLGVCAVCSWENVSPLDAVRFSHHLSRTDYENTTICIHVLQ